jgi:predicted neuraminidase
VPTLRHQVVFREFIFQDRRPFASCHASTLVVLANNEILVAWFGGSKEGADDVAIWMSRRVQGKWQSPTKVADREGIPHWNPVLFQGQDGTIFLFYKVGHKIKEWQTMVMISEDEGHTWTRPEALVHGDIGGRGPVKNKPIILANGTWIAPASIENDEWNAFVDISCDQGRTWVKSEMVPLQRLPSQETSSSSTKVARPGDFFRGKGVIQPTLWESKPGVVHMFLRSTEGHIYRSDSQDSGETWCIAYPAGLPNNNSGIDLVKLDSGILALVYNPIGTNWGPRTPLVVVLSTDNGQSWREELLLEDEEGEYSYPAIVARGETIYITYTWKRKRIAFWQVRLTGSNLDAVLPGI